MCACVRVCVHVYMCACVCVRVCVCEEGGGRMMILVIEFGYISLHACKFCMWQELITTLIL